MTRRVFWKAASLFVLMGLTGGAIHATAQPKAPAACACCGDACECPACTCDAAGVAAGVTACECIVKPSCCAAKSTTVAQAACACCGDACTCTACECDLKAKVDGACGCGECGDCCSMTKG